MKSRVQTALAVIPFTTSFSATWRFLGQPEKPEKQERQLARSATSFLRMTLQDSRAEIRSVLRQLSKVGHRLDSHNHIVQRLSRKTHAQARVEAQPSSRKLPHDGDGSAVMTNMVMKHKWQGLSSASIPRQQDYGRAHESQRCSEQLGERSRPEATDKAT